MLFLGVLKQYLIALILLLSLHTEKFPSRSWDRGFGRSFDAPHVGGSMFAAVGGYSVLK